MWGGHNPQPACACQEFQHLDWLMGLNFLAFVIAPLCPLCGAAKTRPGSATQVVDSSRLLILRVTLAIWPKRLFTDSLASLLGKSWVFWQCGILVRCVLGCASALPARRRPAVRSSSISWRLRAAGLCRLLMQKGCRGCAQQRRGSTLRQGGGSTATRRAGNQKKTERSEYTRAVRAALGVLGPAGAACL